MLTPMTSAAPVQGRLDPLSLGAIVVTLVFWASAFTGIRIGLEHFSPGHLALYRFLVASVTLLLVMAVTRLPVPAPRDLWQIGVLSVAGISLYHVLLNMGERSVPAGTASLIIAAGPVITALLAARFLGESLNPLGWLGTAVSLGGVALIVLGQGQGLGFSAGALLVLARDETAGGRVVGACTAVPLVAEDADFLRAFAAAGIDPATVLYLGEALLEDEYQSRGLGGELLSQVEAHAQALGLPIVAAAMVVRSEDHPQRPRGWRSPSHLLERRGYVMHPELEITLSWQEIGESAPSSKPMRFWVKGLEG